MILYTRKTQVENFSYKNVAGIFGQYSQSVRLDNPRRSKTTSLSCRFFCDTVWSTLRKPSGDKQLSYKSPLVAFAFPRSANETVMFPGIGFRRGRFCCWKSSPTSCRTNEWLLNVSNICQGLKHSMFHELTFSKYFIQNIFCCFLTIYDDV